MASPSTSCRSASRMTTTVHAASSKTPRRRSISPYGPAAAHRPRYASPPPAPIMAAPYRRRPPRIRASAPHAHGHARSDREERPYDRCDPPAIDRVLEEESDRGEQSEHAHHEETALTEPLLEIGRFPRRARNDWWTGHRRRRDRRDAWRRRWRRRARLRKGCDGLWRGARCEEAPHDLLQDLDPPFEAVQRLALLVAHEGRAGGTAAGRREPKTVIASVATARMTRSGTQPSSVRGTAICRKFITKSNRPTSNPSRTVARNERPSCARMLPLRRATAPCPAAMPSVATTSSNRTRQNSCRPAW